jgi:hypothetical protein
MASSGMLCRVLTRATQHNIPEVLTRATRLNFPEVLTRATWHNIPEDAILHSHRHENLKSYIAIVFIWYVINCPRNWFQIIDYVIAHYYVDAVRGSYNIHTA